MDIHWGYSMIEIKKKGKRYELFIDGILMKGIKAYLLGNKYSIEVKAPESGHQLIQNALTELPPFDVLQLDYTFDEVVTSIWIYPSDKSNLRINPPKISLAYAPDYENWNKPYHFTTYCQVMSLAVKATNNPDISYRESGVYGEIDSIHITSPYSSPDLPIAHEIEKRLESFLHIHRKVESSLTTQLSSNVITLPFSFPEEASIACEQYLIYFIQFLHDLGVEATHELKHEAGQSLFSVIPKNPDEALDKIRLALQVYLNLPMTSIENFSTIENDIAIQRLMGEIQSLESRLSLARAEIQFKDATIETQNFLIARQRLLSGKIMADSLQQETQSSTNKDKEKVLDGLAEITVYEGKGVNINLPEVFRRLKRLFKKEK